MVKNSDNGEILGVSLLVVNDQFADPTKIDAAMPCFRLGAFGTERERHKRVNGLFSCVFVDETEGERLLSAALRSQTNRVRADRDRGPGPLGCPRALRLVRPLFSATRLVPDLVTAVMRFCREWRCDAGKIRKER